MILSELLDDFFYRPAVCLITGAALVVVANDHGRTSNPPSNAVTSLLTAVSTSSYETMTAVANTTGVSAVYDTWLDRMPAGSIEGTAAGHNFKDTNTQWLLSIVTTFSACFELVQY
jgi:hypothetical protein